MEEDEKLSKDSGYDDGLVAVLEEMGIATTDEKDGLEVVPEPAEEDVQEWPQPSSDLLALEDPTFSRPPWSIADENKASSNMRRRPN